MSYDRPDREQLASAAVRIAAKVAGLRTDQVDRAIVEYRRAALALHEEPEWAAIMHLSGPSFGLAQYGAEGTRVALQINTTLRGKQWEEERIFTLDGRPFESYGEARRVELEAAARPSPYDIAGHAHDAPDRTA